MTQYQKDSIRESILNIAEQEFTENGFAKTSMRAIAKEAGVTLSNIYNYFKNKDEILKAILEPALKLIESGKNQLEEHEQDHHRLDLQGHLNFIVPTVDFVFKYKKELQLLAFKSKGSSLENYKEDLVDWYVNKMNRKIEHDGNHHNISEFGVSETILYSIANFWMTFIVKSLDENYPIEKAKIDIIDMMTFTHEGWHGVVHMKMKSADENGDVNN